MLHTIKIRNGYGVHANSFFDFRTGLTSITGPNESGKSFILEMIRYALFGTPALRGAVADYKGLEVELVFDVLSKVYRMDRTPREALLMVQNGGDWEPLAAGTKAVNLKIVEIFGYGLTVFDTAHCANQGEIEALGNMLPAARKRMVDSVIGLAVIDDLIKWAGEEANSYKKQAEAIGSTLVQPVEPVKPLDYWPSDGLVRERDRLRLLSRERSELLGFLRAEPAAPLQPELTLVTPVAVLQEHMARRASIFAKLEVASHKLRNTPEAPYTADQLRNMKRTLERFRFLQKAQAFIAGDKEPKFTREQLADYEKLAQNAHEWDRCQALLKGGYHVCPECEHQWPVNNLGDLTKWQDVARPIAPLQHGEIQRHYVDVERYEARAEERRQFAAAKAVLDPGYSEGQLEGWERALVLQPQRQALFEEILGLEAERNKWPDRTAELEDAKRLAAAWETYHARKTAWDDFQVQKSLTLVRLEEIGPADETLKAVEQRLFDASMYEAAVTSYDKAKSVYEHALALGVEAQTKGEEYSRAKTALTIFKTKVKSHLVPSLARVASVLLSDMTGGKRERIEIDDEFNILVDGQALNTLSGSGKAVANLAIRIGLGQVLTNRVFSVFMGDELDAAMDQERAGFTAETLRRLTNKIQQVFIVSHKRPEADNYIDLAEAA